MQHLQLPKRRQLYCMTRKTKRRVRAERRRWTDWTTLEAAEKGENRSSLCYPPEVINIHDQTHTHIERSSSGGKEGDGGDYIYSLEPLAYSSLYPNARFFLPFSLSLSINERWILKYKRRAQSFKESSPFSERKLGFYFWNHGDEFISKAEKMLD